MDAPAPAISGDAACVADVAHDLNNVLLAVRGYAELIRRKADSPEAVKGFAGEITGACESAHALTRQLLALESPHAGQAGA